jgi:Tol biopolymer transport system component
MKRTDLRRIGLTVIIAVLPAMVSAVLFLTAESAQGKNGHANDVAASRGPANGDAPDSPSLRGAEAVRSLKESGQYDSLLDALQNSLDRDGHPRAAATTDAFGLRKKLIASNAAADNFFGFSVAISGSTAIVGASRAYQDGKAFQGAAYVFVRNGFNWVEQAVLTASDGEARDEFGVSVAISGDSAVVGAWHDNVGPTHDQGSAYVFVRTGTVWNEETKLIGADSNAGDEFGSAVAIDGATVAVGSRRGGAGFEASGAVYAFVKGTTWTQQQKIVANDPENLSRFGSDSLALNGQTLIVGAAYDTINGNAAQGSAYVFVRGGNSWVFQQKLFESTGGQLDYFGFSVSISGDTAVVGAYGATVGGNAAQGKAVVYARSGVTWTVQQELIPDGSGPNDHVGVSVAIDGETILVGAHWDTVTSNRQGSAYVFLRAGSAWNQQQKLIASDASALDEFGRSVALSGETAVVGAVFDSVTRFRQGTAYVFGSDAAFAGLPDRIAFSSARDGNDEIYTMNPDGSGQTRLTNALGADVTPSVSGDGGLIAFSSNRDGNAEIYVMNADGSNQTRLTNNAASDTQPSFSRDGLKIVFRSDRDGNEEIYVMNVNGTNLRRLTNNALSDSAPSFSPAGTRVLFERVDASNRDLYTMDAADGGNVTRLTTATAADFAGNFARSGTRIVFASGRNGNNEIYVMNADGTGQTRITNNSSTDTEPFFSPDGTKIVFETDRDGNSEIYTMNADGTGAARLTNNTSADRNPDWSGVPPQSTAGRVTASDGLPGDTLGTSVAISGNTAVIGAPWDDFGANIVQGSAYVFVKVGGAWVEQQKLSAADGGDGDQFGYSVGISGETLIVGAWQDATGANSSQGSAYIFTRSGTAWSQQAKLVAPDGAPFDFFGESVAIDGSTVVVGAASDNIGPNADQGTVHVFVRNGSAWQHQQALTAADGAATDRFGTSVAISGETIVIGARGDDIGANADQGSAYVFVRNGMAWALEQKITASDGTAGDTLGRSVAIAGDTIIAGAPGDNPGGGSFQGSAYVFARSGTAWTQQQKLFAVDGAANDSYGTSVSLSGENALVGANQVDVSAANQGAAYSYTRSGGSWTLRQKALAPDAAANDSFGSAVAVSGENAVAGAPGKNVAGNATQGAAYFFYVAPLPAPTPTPVPTPEPTIQPNTPVGAPVTVQIPDASVTFPAVGQAGNTSFTPIIPPSSAGSPPAGYVICATCPAYDITTTASYTPPITVCLGVPNDIDSVTFSSLILLHGEAGVLVDRTTGRFTSESGDRSVCGSVSSLSPFALARPLVTPTPTPGGSSVSGVVTYGTTPAGQSTRFVPGVALTAVGSVPANATTNASGAYALTGLSSGAYTITPTKSGDVNGSVSGLDAARVAQHVAGLITLTPNQQIAGDATNNGSLSGLDAARIAQTAAGLANPGIAGQWKFLPASRTYQSVTGPLSGENYEAILVGEVTGNWTPPAGRALNEIDADPESVYSTGPAQDPDGVESAFTDVDNPDSLEVGFPCEAAAIAETGLTVPISIGETTAKGILAYDLTVAYDPIVLIPADEPVERGLTLSQEWTVMYNDRSPGMIRITAYGTTGMIGKGNLLELRFRRAANAERRGPAIFIKNLQLNEGEVPVRLSNGCRTMGGIEERAALPWFVGSRARVRGKKGAAL